MAASIICFPSAMHSLSLATLQVSASPAVTLYVYTVGNDRSTYGSIYHGVEPNLERLRAGERTIDVFAVTLLQADRIGLKEVMRYLNLTFSTVNTVWICAGRWNSEWELLPAEVQPKLKHWINASAQDCSARILALEKQLLEEFKNAGIEAVPVNRRPFIEAAYRGVAVAEWRSDRNWLMDELESVIKLGPVPAGVSLPSRYVGAESKQLETGIWKNCAVHEERWLGARLRDVWWDAREELAARVAALQVKLPEPFLEPMVRPKAQSVGSLLSLARHFEKLVRARAPCVPFATSWKDLSAQAVQKMPRDAWCTEAHGRAARDWWVLARAYWSLSETEALGNTFEAGLPFVSLPTQYTTAAMRDFVFASKLGELAAEANHKSAQQYADAIVKNAQVIYSGKAPAGEPTQQGEMARRRIAHLAQATRIFIKAGDRSRALALYEEAIGLFSEYVEGGAERFYAASQLAQLSWELGRHQEAWQFFSQSIASAPDPINVHAFGTWQDISGRKWSPRKFAVVNNTVSPILRDEGLRVVLKLKGLSGGKVAFSSDATVNWYQVVEQIITHTIELEDYSAAERILGTFAQLVSIAPQAQKEPATEALRLAGIGLADAYTRSGDKKRAHLVAGGRAVIEIEKMYAELERDRKSSSHWKNYDPFQAALKAKNWDAAEKLIPRYDYSIGTAAEQAVAKRTPERSWYIELIVAAAKANDLAAVHRLVKNVEQSGRTFSEYSPVEVYHSVVDGLMSPEWQ